MVKSYISTAYSQETIIKAGVAHLWFVVIHPFDES